MDNKETYFNSKEFRKILQRYVYKDGTTGVF